MIYLVATVHIVVSIFLILVVLLQRGSGADLSVFGGGGTQAAFGARSAASVLHKMTVWAFVAFIVTTISYNFLASDGNRGSVLSGAAAELPVASEVSEETDPVAEPVVPAAAEATDEATPAADDAEPAAETVPDSPE